MALEPQSAPKFQPALLAGLFIGILSSLPFVNVLNCCCLWVIAGGVLAAYVMQQNHPAPITIGDGAVVGLLAGFFGAIMQFACALVLEQLLGQLSTGFSENVMRSGRQDMPPEVRRFMNEIGPRGLLVIGSILFGAMSILFAMLGGVLGAVLFRKPSPPGGPLSGPLPGPPVPWTPPPPLQEPAWPPSLPDDTASAGAAPAGPASAGPASADTASADTASHDTASRDAASRDALSGETPPDEKLR